MKIAAFRQALFISSIASMLLAVPGLSAALPRVVQAPAAASSIKWDEVPEDSRECLKCHISKSITGSAIRDWQLSKHFGAGVGCATCHLPVKDAVKAITESASACENKQVRRAVSPRNCAQCHPGQMEQFSSGKHAAAWIAMTAMPTTAE